MSKTLSEYQLLGEPLADKIIRLMEPLLERRGATLRVWETALLWHAYEVEEVPLDRRVIRWDPGFNAWYLNPDFKKPTDQ